MTLRKIIRHYIEDHTHQMNFLDSIATAQGEQTIQKNVLEIYKENSALLEEQSGIQSSMTENEIGDYMQIVINETKNLDNTLGGTRRIREMTTFRRKYIHAKCTQTTQHHVCLTPSLYCLSFILLCFVLWKIQ